MILRRLLALASLALAVVLPGAGRAAEPQFPRGPVRIIIPFPAGGPTDTVARLTGQKLQEFWGQPVVLDFKPGAGTMIGVDAVAKAAPDGYTFGMVNSSLAVNPSLHRKVPYDTLKDLSPITQLANLQLAIVARPEAPFGSLAELIAYAKQNPGKMFYGTPGSGSTMHLGMELLKRMAGFDVVHAPFKGSAPAHTELLGGRIDLVVDPFLSVVPYVKAGRMKMIATGGDKRVPGYEYPTVAETVPGFNVSGLLGFVAPAGTPREVIEKIQADTARALNQPELKKRIEELGMTVVASTPEQFAAWIRSEMQRWGKVVAEAGIQAE